MSCATGGSCLPGPYLRRIGRLWHGAQPAFRSAGAGWQTARKCDPERRGSCDVPVRAAQALVPGDPLHAVHSSRRYSLFGLEPTPSSEPGSGAAENTLTMSAINERFARPTGPTMNYDRKSAPRNWLPIAFILAVSITVRLAHLLAGPMVIEPEGAYYARVAENLAAGSGWVGMYARGLQLIYPPLYPLLIAGVHILGPHVELAARLVSLLFGSLLVVPVLLISRFMYGQRVWYVAALITAIHPVLVGISTAVFSESTYLFLLFMGIFCAMVSARDLSCRSAIIAGALVGLAYMTRPEALLTVCFLFLVVLVCGWNHKRRAGRVAVCLAAACMVAGSPYMWFLKMHTGQFRLEAKSADNFAIEKMLSAGMAPIQAYRLVDDDLRPIGVTMRSDLDVMRATKVSLPTALRLAKAVAPQTLRYFVSVLFEKQALGGVVLIGLVTMGLLRSAWDRKRAVREGFVVAYLACLVLPLLSWWASTSRFAVVFLPVLIVWASNGVEEVGAWLGETWTGISRNQECELRARVVGIVGSAGALLLLSWLTVASFEDLRPGDPALKRAGLELKRRFPTKKLVIMDMDPIVTFYAGGIYRAFPYCTEKTALRYISANQVDIIVCRQNGQQAIPYYQDWVTAGIPDDRASFILGVPSAKQGRIVLYGWH